MFVFYLIKANKTWQQNLTISISTSNLITELNYNNLLKRKWLQKM